MNKNENDKKTKEYIVDVTAEKQNRMQLLTGGLAGAGFATILAYVTREKLTESLSISLWFLAAALPFHLHCLFYTNLFEANVKIPDAAYLRIGVVNSIGGILSLAGYVFLFRHFGSLYGWVFMVAGLLAFWGSVPIMNHLKKGIPLPSLTNDEKP
ncbi:hypothetical protein KI811_01210 [Geobacter hydrogenophilus]|uniref:Uncharacterized protein n=1 Tax=Geobacter hydrogenophilus TaxID=40983 RepID=A0A9W6G3R9_9BACT|nr:hypothetical protein [Geobacter hydrogenophilus]MBT0892437.1 hypothetical protein [Geobacter hydrogenophilus]GLI39834.1 hypothetical protein GHYDROH2_33350 [Geobacter hydrogenophilus]